MTAGPLRDGRRFGALKIVTGYAAVAAVWVVFSDAAVNALIRDPRLLHLASTLKGWAFVAATAGILYALLRRYLHEIEVSEQGLRASERRLERIVGTIPSGVLLIGKDGRMTMANEAAQRILRLSADEIAVRRFDDPEWGAETLDGRPLGSGEFPSGLVAATGGPVSDVRFTVLHADGTRAVLSSNASPLLDENGEAVATVSALSDITDAYTAERKLIHVNRLYSMLSQTNEAIVRIRDERELYEAACRITVEYGQFKMAWIGVVDGTSGVVVPAAFAGDERDYLKVVRITTHENEDEGRGPVGTAARLGRTVVSNDVVHDPFVLAWRDLMLERGYRSLAAFPLATGGEVFGAFAIYASEPDFFDSEEIRLLEDLAEDIAFGVSHIRQERDRVEAEGKLRRWKEIFDETATGIAVTEGPDVSTICQANSAYARMHGYEPGQVIGRPVLEFIAPEDRDAMLVRFSELDRVGHLVFEAMRLRKDGSVFPAEMDVTAVYEPDGRVAMRIGNVQDITERRAAEDELARHREHLEELVSERTAELRRANGRLREATEAKSRFLANMSHELRTPLNSVIGFTDMMLQGMAGAVNLEQEKQLGMVNRAGKQLLGLVNDVLEISKIEAGRMEAEASTFSIGSLVEDVSATTGPLADERRLPLEIGVRDADAVLETDREKLCQVLVNVVANAIKFTERGSVRLEASLDGADALFTVTDTGVGIAPEDLGRIFDEFEQAKRPPGSSRSVRGTGLGLAISKRLTELLGGTLGVESERGRGSVFTLRVPREMQEQTTKGSRG